MYISECRLTFESLERALNLPANCKVVAVQEEDTKGLLKFRIVSATPAPEEYSFEHLSMVGEAYAYPEKYTAKSNKGPEITAPAPQPKPVAQPSREVADVAIL